MTTALDELRQLAQWVAWRYGSRNGELTKIPVTPHGDELVNASSTNPATWGTYEQATRYAKAHALAGAGFVFSENDPYCGIDLDDCLEDGRLAPWALEIIEALATYCEVSPSGTGVKLWGRGRLPGNGLNAGDVELYDHGRYFTWTGRRLAGTPETINDCQTAVTALYERTRARKVSKAPALAISAGNHSPYAQAALDGELDALARTAEGQRNDQLNRAAFSLGQLVASGLLARGDVESQLAATAAAIGLSEREAWATIRSGLDSGGKSPREAPATNGHAVSFSSNGHGPAIVEDADFQPAMVDVLDLPAAARLSEDLGADVGGWLADYVRYASEVSERTPAIIHQAAGLYLVSVAVARRLVLPMRHADIFPNLYILAVAPTTLYAKTTGLGVMTSLLDDGIPHLQLSNESTPEALLAELAGREPPNLDSKEISDQERETWKHGQRFAAQRGLVLEEASALLAGMKREYMQGMAELLLRLYDCPRLYRRHTRGGGYAMIRHAYMSFCGWTTPARLRTAEIETGWQDGLFARFALVTPTEAPQRPADDGYSKGRPQRPAALLEELTRLANSLLPTPDEYPKPVTARAMGITDDARAAWYRYYQATSYDLLTSRQAPDARLHGTYGRLSTAALKVSMLLAALDWSRSGGGDEPLVTLAHYAAAQRIAESWRASAHRLLNTLSAKAEAEEEDRDLRRLLNVMERNPDQWLAVRDVVRSLPSKQYTTATVSILLRILVDDGRVEAAEHKPDGRGRPSMRYRIVSM